MRVSYNWPSNVGSPCTEEGRKNPSTLLLRTLVTASMLTDLLSFFYGKLFLVDTSDEIEIRIDSYPAYGQREYLTNFLRI